MVDYYTQSSTIMSCIKRQFEPKLYPFSLEVQHNAKHIHVEKEHPNGMKRGTFFMKIESIIYLHTCTLGEI